MATITKRELGRFLRREILPQFGSEWTTPDNIWIVRVQDFIVQGVAFDSSAYSKRLVPNYFIQVLAIPRHFFALTLGSRLKDPRGGDLWLEWAPDDEQQTQRILSLLHEQAQPSLVEPLTLEGVAQYIETYHRKSFHFDVGWSLGVIYGVLGKLDAARQQLGMAEWDLCDRAKGWEKEKKPPPAWILETIESIAEFKLKLENANMFREYCETQAQKTALALKLPVPPRPATRSPPSPATTTTTKPTS